MALLLGVNSYGSAVEADFYFDNRADATDWMPLDALVKERFLTTATQIIDSLSFAGYASSGNQPLAWPRQGSVNDSSRGRTIQFTNSYDFRNDPVDQVGMANPNGGTYEFYEEVFADLPIEVQLLKRALFEQAFHLHNNNTLLETTTATTAGTGNISQLSVGSISLNYDLARAPAAALQVPVQSPEMRRYLRPLMGSAGGSIWFRAN